MLGDNVRQLLGVAKENILGPVEEHHMQYKYRKKAVST